jgi:serpin B
VKMMNGYYSVWYYETKDAQIVLLPYKDKYRSMVVVVPRTVDGLPAVEQSLTPADVRKWFAEGEERSVRLSLPVFKARFRDNLVETFKAMGMRSPFEPGADFSGLSTDLNFVISKVIHEAVVEVNEEGTKAAAATAVVVVDPVSAQPPPKKDVVVRADRPFLFLIHDNATGNILFVGRVATP